jgi:hypothetical protein
MGITFRSLPKIVEGESVDERLKKLFVWSESLDGYLYSIGSALTELRKEIAILKDGQLRHG